MKDRRQERGAQDEKASDYQSDGERRVHTLVKMR